MARVLLLRLQQQIVHAPPCKNTKDIFHGGEELHLFWQILRRVDGAGVECILFYAMRLRKLRSSVPKTPFRQEHRLDIGLAGFHLNAKLADVIFDDSSCGLLHHVIRQQIRRDVQLSLGDSEGRSCGLEGLHTRREVVVNWGCMFAWQDTLKKKPRQKSCD